MANNNTRISNPTLLVNNIPIAIVPNSFSYTEGLGAQTGQPQSAGGTSTQVVYGEDVSTKMSMIKFSLSNTAQNIAMMRAWKIAGNNNRIVGTASDVNGTSLGWSRNFNHAFLTDDPEVGLGSESAIELTWNSDPCN